MKDNDIEKTDTQDQDRFTPDLNISLCENLTLKEAVHSDTAIKAGIENMPVSQEQIDTLVLTARKLFQPLRRFWKTPIAVTSMFRSPDLNTAIGGSKNSDHMACRAIDLDAHVYGGITNRQIFEFFRDNCTFDQLIWEEGDDNEPAWIHVSYRANANRMQVLRKIRKGKKVTWQQL